MGAVAPADMGATVIKIEDKGAGDYARTMSHVRNELSQLFIAVNRGKQFLHLLFQPSDGCALVGNRLFLFGEVSSEFLPHLLPQRHACALAQAHAAHLDLRLQACTGLAAAMPVEHILASLGTAFIKTRRRLTLGL